MSNQQDIAKDDEVGCLRLGYRRLVFLLFVSYITSLKETCRQAAGTPK